MKYTTIGITPAAAAAAAGVDVIGTLGMNGVKIELAGGGNAAKSPFPE